MSREEKEIEEDTNILPRLFIGYHSSVEKTDLSPRTKEKKIKSVIMKQMLELEQPKMLKEKIMKKKEVIGTMDKNIRKKMLSMMIMDLEEKIFMVDSFNNLDLRKLTRIDNQNGKKAMIHREAIEKDKLDREIKESEIDKKEEVFEKMLKTISAYYLKLKAKQEVMNDNKDSIDLMAQGKQNELKRLKKMIKILNKDLVEVSKETGASITFEFLNTQQEPSTTHRSLGNGGSRRVNMNQTFDFSSYPTRHDSDDSFAMNQSTNTSMILPRSVTSKKKKKGGKLAQLWNTMFQKKKSVG